MGGETEQQNNFLNGFTNKTTKMRELQVIKCKCGKVFAAAQVPECYMEKEWMDELRDYVVNKGCTVDIVFANGNIFEKCECDKQSIDKK